jgi:UDP-2,3-diacylglucosamine pyrophosphatase LpxH
MNTPQETRVLPNLLVISDLHLGEDLLPGASEENRSAVAMASAAFCEFLRYHARFRVDGRPWRLVINGDLFDFMSVHAGAADGVALDAREEAHTLGAGRREDASIVRMRLMGARYRAVFAQMMRFTGAGHRIDIIIGNHDQELMWSSVWAELQQALLAACPTGVDADAAIGRIGRHRWFIHEPGVAWIEHGHQYDDACSFEFGLASTDPRSGEIATNVDYAALRYISAAAPDVDTHGTEEWSFGGYLQFVASRGPRALVHYVGSYAKFVRALFAARKVHRSIRVRATRAAAHDRALDALAASTGVTRKQLDLVDRLARSPMTRSTRRLMRMLRLDRMLILFGVVIAALIALIALPLWAGVIAAAGAAAGGYKVAELIGPPPAVQAAMTVVPRQIAAIVGVPAVVFGHTHEPLKIPMSCGTTYLNAGTWLPATRPGLLRSFTHVAILRNADGGARSELRQWKNGASRPYVERRDPTPAPVSIPVPDAVPAAAQAADSAPVARPADDVAA